MFLDYLNLKDKKLENTIILYGRSGSGKSTYAKWIKELHPEYLVIDEIWSIRQILKLFLNKTEKKIICSHLSEKYFFFLKNKSFFNLDLYPKKIQYALDSKGMTYNQSDLKKFCANFQTSFVDLDIVLENPIDNNFSLTLERFLRTHKIELKPQYEFKL